MGGRARSRLLPLVACAACAAGKEPASDSGAAPSLRLFGSAVQARDGAPAQVRVWAEGAPTRVATSDAEGAWTLAVADAPWVQLHSEADGRLPMRAWIDPREITDQSNPYTYSVGTPDDVVALLDALGAAGDPERHALLFVDAIDPEMHDIAGAQVELSGGFDGPWREVEAGVWDNEPLTTEDRSDLLFTQVPEGPLTLRAVDPSGAPCEVPPEIRAEAAAIIQVSVYCDHPAPPPPAARSR
jgi:hypothetical protein